MVMRLPEIDLNCSSSQIALAWVKAGYEPFPVSPFDKKPYVPWSTERARTADEAEQLWRQHPNAMIGIPTGDGLFALDVDHDPAKGHDVNALLKSLRERFGLFDDTPTVVTPRDGVHLFFATPPGITVKCSASQLAPGVDVRGGGGFVIAAGSRRADGKRYQYANAHRTLLAPPPALVEAVRKKPRTPPRAIRVRSVALPGRTCRYARKAMVGEVDAVANAASGTRNDALNRAAYALGTLVGASRLPKEPACAALYQAASHNGLVDDDGPRAVWATIESGLNAGIANPREVARW